MELKHSSISSISPGVSVLIVPLWNWNTDKGTEAAQRQQRINCTVVELKQIYQKVRVHAYMY